MKAYFHSLSPPVVMPRDDYLNEHIRLVSALASGDPSALNNELKEQRADLGKAIKGGRGRASGFIMRAMAENKLKHSGQYKNPTYPLAPGSTMNKPIEFDWKKLANKSQGGEKETGNKTHWGTKGEYGASPFILHHFSGSPKESKKGDKGKESDIQRKARMIFTAKNLLAKAKTLVSETPTLEITEVAPEAPKPQIIEHFGNAPELKADEPPTPPKPLVETPKPEPEPVKRRVIKVSKKPKVAESPTPSNPVPRVVWTEAELKSNPLTRRDTANYYDDLDDRQQKLLLFALNTPKAKLADAIKYLKDNSIGKGFAPATISPIFKELRKVADDILEDEEKQSKTLSNPAYEGIKSKLSQLLANKSSRPLERIKNAFKGIDVDKYLNIYNEVTDKTGADVFDTEKMLVYNGDNWTLFGGKKYSKTYKKLSGATYASGFDPSEATLEDHPHKYGNPTYWGVLKKAIDVTDASGKAVSVGKNIIVQGLHKKDGKYHIADESIALYVPSSQFPDPEETPEQQILSNSPSRFGSQTSTKPMSRIFYQKDLYLYNQGYWIGNYLSEWAGNQEHSKGRKRKIGNARRINAMVKEIDSNDWLYTTKIGSVEYVCPKKESLHDLEPKETPEEAKAKAEPSKPPSREGDWTKGNIVERSDRPEETSNWIEQDLSPDELETLLVFLNSQYLLTDKHHTLLNRPVEGNKVSGKFKVPDAKARSLYDDAKDLKNDFDTRWKTYDDAKGDYDRSRSKKKGGAYKLNKVSDADAKDPEEIRRLPIRNKARYDKARANLLEALSKYTVPQITTRAPLLGKETGTAKKGESLTSRGVAFGFGNNRRGYDYYVKNKAHPEVYKALVEFGECIVPKGWDFQTIQLNHNAKAKKHLDKNNVGKSVIVGIGDYTGGELRIFSPDSSKYHDYSLKDNPTMFNGAVLPHETQPFSSPSGYERGKGRYTIVYFRHKYKPGSGNVGVGSGHVGSGIGQPPAKDIEDMFV